jgi:hypothetical protein
MDDRWLLHKFEIAAKEVIEYKKHIVRAIHQDRAKGDIMDKISREEALLIFDFAMKFLPQKFREAQTDFFAKKGLLPTPIHTGFKYQHKVFLGTLWFVSGKLKLGKST